MNILDLGTLGVRAVVSGTEHDYGVLIDFEDVSDNVLFAMCTCPRFASGYLCKHLWATILELDRVQDNRLRGHGPIEICESDMEDFEVGEPLEVADYQPTLPPPTTQRGKPAPGWMKQLQVAAQIASVKAPAAVVPQHPVVTGQRIRHEFLISLADQANASSIDLHLMRSTQDPQGRWSEPLPARISRAETALLHDPAEQRIFAMLQWENDFQSAAVHRRGGATRFRIHPHLLSETLAELCESQRLAWTHDIASTKKTRTPIVQATGTAWDFVVALDPIDSPAAKPKGNRGREAATSMLAVMPRLERVAGEATERREIGCVMAVCDSGALLMDDCIAAIDPQVASWVRGWQRIGELQLAADEMGTFLETFFSAPEPPRLELAKSLDVSQVQGKPQPKLTLSSPDDEHGAYQWVAEVTMLYGDRELQADDPIKVVWDEAARVLLVRDAAAELAALQTLKECDFREHSPRFRHFELRISRWSLVPAVLKLTGRGWLVVAEGQRMRSPGGCTIEVASGEDWFDLKACVDFDGMEVALPALLKALKRKETFVVLDDGSHGILPEQWLNQLQQLSQAGQIEGESVRYRRNQALLLELLLAEQENVKTDRSFNAWCERMRSFSGIKPAVEPRGFQGTLRAYQKDGLGWFHFLRDFEFGGCLADDMGLGKTIQVLALLQSRRLARPKAGRTKKPSLVVVPKSLIFNWIAEAEKFAPRLKVVDYTGNQRAALVDRLESADLVLTTYGTLRRDIEQIRSLQYDYAILDEAQAIKNPNSQSAKAARLIDAEHRLAMTGTPVENHLGDLWSLLDFLNPGMLGQLSVSQFSGPDVSSERLVGLSNALQPFILRRTKEQVLTELPEKSEQTLYCTMTGKQRKLYDELRNHYRQQLSGKVKELGIKRSKIHVLEALLRLRQTACDPRLVDAKQGPAGAKIARLMEQLQEVTAEGHKALVFSQFTSLLSFVRKELDQQGIVYEYLDGKTTKRNERVARFQSDPDCPVFLISLKAGGHGLNLTAADYVYILDPWWNPAVEAQAIDRAHRMGQSKPVMAYRLICRDTVEEKIVHLQESKRELADAIISADRSLISQLSMDDLQMLFS
ncbi:SNF2-related protein [Rosistilla carotiformis]|uniref:SNF2-related protein n=1 Tax=Rosistilla carotiformis TaxID=2528017 RepID=UPI0018D2307C|nr:SNF2-related protein [Rosistilla carotiformis]